MIRSMEKCTLEEGVLQRTSKEEYQRLFLDMQDGMKVLKWMCCNSIFRLMENERVVMGAERYALQH
jgi:hypothetical protein